MTGFMDVYDNINKKKTGEQIRWPVSMVAFQKFKRFVNITQGKESIPKGKEVEKLW